MGIKQHRFLRDSELRAALYSNAGGNCEGCGEPLTAGWHANHVIPWVASRRTNVFEMAALCQRCNLSKGATMLERLSHFTVDIDKFRPGQLGAYQETIKRVRANEQHTAIVLPTRYGKTDFMRVTGLELIRLGLVSSAMIMAPGKALREQSLRNEELLKCLHFYGINSEVSKYEVVRPPNFDRLTKSHLIATTTSMATTHVATLQHWIDHMIRRVGAPPIVFLDEAHMSSDENVWGQTMESLAEAGAFICLCTATPYRTDKGHIPGFKVDRVETIRQTTGAGDYIYERETEVYELKAHWITTFRDAWDEGNTLCRIARRPFKINLSKVGEMDMGKTWLSELSMSDCDRILGRVLKHPIVVEDSCKVLAEELAWFRKLAPRSAGIVFVGNDNDSSEDKETDGHANMVKTALAAYGLQAVIATSSETSDGLAAITRFVSDTEGKGGDVLVVKQMASRGLDIPRLEVGLDLSPARLATNAFVQRSMRIATRYPFGEGRTLTSATYIAPDDARMTQLFESLISDQGGEYHGRGDWRVVGPLPGTLGGESGGKPSRGIPEFEVIGTAPPDFVEDSSRVYGKGEFLPFITDILDEEPELRHLTTARLANAFERAVENFHTGGTGGVVVMGPPSPPP